MLLSVVASEKQATSLSNIAASSITYHRPTNAWFDIESFFDRQRKFTIVGYGMILNFY